MRSTSAAASVNVIVCLSADVPRGYESLSRLGAARSRKGCAVLVVPSSRPSAAAHHYGAPTFARDPRDNPRPQPSQRARNAYDCRVAGARNEPSTMTVSRPATVSRVKGVTVLVTKGPDQGRTVTIEQPSFVVGVGEAADFRLKD